MAAANTRLLEVRSPQGMKAAVAGGKPVVLHFWASWCEPCRQMDAVLAQLAADLPDLTCARVEAEVVDDVTVQYGVTTVPYFVFLKEGKVVDRLEGADPPALAAKATALARGGGDATASAAGTAHGAVETSAAPDGGSSFSSSGGGVFGRIKYLLATWPVVLFMKGPAEAPRCGFSGRVVDALHELGVAFKSVDVLQDEELRLGLKEYGNWPTYPQLYVKGELVGGCDIVTEMAAGGDLEALIRDKLGPNYKAVAAAAAAAGPAATAAAAAPASAAPAAAGPAAAGPPPSALPASAPSESVRERIRALLHGPQSVMLFMKGSPDAPRCGFSRRVVEALQAEGLEFGSFDILQDEAIRQGLKEYSNWPTYPQLYVRGELLGGCDIVTEMRANGELGSSIREMTHRMDVP